MPGFIGQKLGMTRLLTDKGELKPVTVLKLLQNEVVQVKTEEKDGYKAYVSGVLPKGDSKSPGNKYTRIREFRFDNGDFEKGKALAIDLLEGIEEVSVEGVSKGKGFQGGIKRHNFHGLRATHGSMCVRAIGSTGTRKPRRTHKGKKMAGHMGSEQVTLHGRNVVKLDKDNSLLAISGGVPGAINSFVYIFWK